MNHCLQQSWDRIPSPPSANLSCPLCSVEDPGSAQHKGCDWWKRPGPLQGNTPPLSGSCRRITFPDCSVPRGSACLTLKEGPGRRQRKSLMRVSHLKLRLPCFCHGARGIDPRARPLSLDLLIPGPSPRVYPTPLRLWAARWDAPQLPRGWRAPLSLLPPTVSPTSEKSSCHQNMG